MDRHWRAFLEDVTWFLKPGDRAEVRAWHPAGWWAASGGVADTFPALTALLRAAEVTEVSARGDDYLLFTWSTAAGPRSWLCRTPPEHPPRDVYPAHAMLLGSFGGIVERSNEPEECWLLNQNDVLTAAEASRDASFVEHYAWAFEEVPGGIPIALRDYYSVAREANGNTTLCHRRDGTILLFAHDHAFDHVTPLAGCPPYTLYTLEGAARFVDWVETIAKQWAVYA